MKADSSIQPRLAVVTGGSSGIGLCIAVELALRGYDLLLASRKEEKLRAAAESIRKEAEAKGLRIPSIHTLSIDLTEPHAAERLIAFATGLSCDVEVLVNDAGMYLCEDFLATPSHKADSLIQLNVESVVSLCRLFGQHMKAKRHGYILNIASYSFYMPYPGWALYSGSKAFVRNFSLAFADELKPHGINVTTAAPAGVATELMGLKPHIFRLGIRTGFLMQPRTAARRCVRALFRGRRYVIPGWYNHLWIPILRHLGPRGRRLFKQIVR